MRPEEKLAARLLERHILSPPFDLVELVKKHADLEFLPFPAQADGIVIGPKARMRPKVFINNLIPPTRQHFTLAHELGHIIIPWHIGNFVSHTESPNSQQANIEYREMETESNRFAAELLMPSKWIKSTLDNSLSFQPFFEQILEDSKSSRDAALIKVFNCIPSGYICAVTETDGAILRAFHSPKTIENLRVPEHTIYYADDISFNNSKKESFYSGDKQLVVWKLNQKERLPVRKDVRPWRDIINSILEETNLSHKLQSINAILGTNFHSQKGKTLEEIFYAIKVRYSRAQGITPAVDHPSFDQYILKRIIELKERYK